MPSLNISSCLPFASNSSLRILLCTAFGLTFFLLLQYGQASARQRKFRTIIPSPLTSLLPNLSKGEVENLPYPPDVLPGARNVETPYGNIRVYEWGPENGRKVLLVHGISTPCISLAGVAEKLVDKGCRVMLFDLFGRGYSSLPPASLQHNAALYTTQILLALSSSPLPWTGTNGFSIVGYSLGGGISASFTSYFPHLVRSLILIAPSGILREKHIAWQSKILYRTEGILPERLVNWLVNKRLSAGPLVSNRPVHWSEKDERREIGIHPPVSVKTAVTNDLKSSTYEVGEEGGKEGEVKTAEITHDQNSPLFADRPNITVPSSVQWQLRHHMGFIPAFISSIRYAPITNCHSTYSTIGSRLSAQKAKPNDKEAQAQGLERGKVLVLLGKDDQIIIQKEIEPDMQECLGKGNVEFVAIEAAHELPITRAKEIVDAVLRFWNP